MIDIFSVWVKPKYTYEDVVRLYLSCSKYIKVPFRFVCLTDHNWNREPIETIQVGEYELDTWWNKLLIFDPQFSKNNTSLYFDLDTKITTDITYMIDELDDDHLFVVDTPWKDQEYFNQTSSRVNTKAFLEYGNTSVMGWKNKSHGYLLGILMSDIFKHTAEHYGDDTFINRSGNIKYFKSVSIDYSNADILINHTTKNIETVLIY